MPSGESPNSKKNLTYRLAPGQSRPPSTLANIMKEVRAMLPEPCPHDKERRPYLRVIAERYLEACTKPGSNVNRAAISDLLDRLHGRPIQVSVDANLAASRQETLDSLTQRLEDLKNSDDDDRNNTEPLN
jgi:hypothetical protein